MMKHSTFLLFILAPLMGSRNTVTPVITPIMELQGMDVSHYQKEIDWDMVAERQVLDFAFVKATEGHNYRDSLFCRNWENLRRLGIRRGAYHFFRAYGCGDEQASNFLQFVEMLPGDLAPVLDIEVTNGIEPEIMIQEARIWLDIIESTLGVRPIIYTNQYFYERYLAGHFEDYPLWIARYSDVRPLLTTGKRWDIWQYSSEGCLDGVPKKVDLNVFPGTWEMLDRLCWFPPSVDTDSSVAP